MVPLSVAYLLGASTVFQAVDPCPVFTRPRAGLCEMSRGPASGHSSPLHPTPGSCCPQWAQLEGGSASVAFLVPADPHCPSHLRGCAISLYRAALDGGASLPSPAALLGPGSLCSPLGLRQSPSLAFVSLQPAGGPGLRGHVSAPRPYNLPFRFLTERASSGSWSELAGGGSSLGAPPVLGCLWLRRPWRPLPLRARAPGLGLRPRAPISATGFSFSLSFSPPPS